MLEVKAKIFVKNVQSPLATSGDTEDSSNHNGSRMVYPT